MGFGPDAEGQAAVLDRLLRVVDLEELALGRPGHAVYIVHSLH